MGYWKSKPPVGTRLRRGHPLAQGLAYTFLLNGTAADSVCGQSLPLLNGAKFAPSPTGNALLLAGQPDGKAQTGGAANLPVSKIFSFEVWVSVTTYTDLSCLCAFGANPTGGGPVGNLRGIMQYSGGVYFWGNSADWGTPQAWDTSGKFHHLVFTSDGTTLRFYYDGKFRTSTALPALIALPAAANFVTLGSIHPSAAATISGQVSKYSIAGRAWNAQEVAQLYADPYDMFAAPVWQRNIKSGGRHIYIFGSGRRSL